MAYVKEILVESKRTLQVGEGKEYVSATREMRVVFEDGELKIGEAADLSSIPAAFAKFGATVDNALGAALDKYTGDGSFKTPKPPAAAKSGTPAAQQTAQQKPPAAKTGSTSGDAHDAELASPQQGRAFYAKCKDLEKLGVAQVPPLLVKNRIGSRTFDKLSHDEAGEILDALSAEIDRVKSGRPQT